MEAKIGEIKVCRLKLNKFQSIDKRYFHQKLLFDFSKKLPLDRFFFGIFDFSIISSYHFTLINLNGNLFSKLVFFLSLFDSNLD